MAITWTDITSNERLIVELETDFTSQNNCSMFVNQMPSKLPQFGSTLVEVEGFSINEHSFSFVVVPQESALSMLIWILTPESTNFCSGTSFSGSTYTSAMITTWTGGFPQALGSYFNFILPYS
jgi:hypothetical protein